MAAGRRCPGVRAGRCAARRAEIPVGAAVAHAVDAGLLVLNGRHPLAPFAAWPADLLPAPPGATSPPHSGAPPASPEHLRFGAADMCN